MKRGNLFGPYASAGDGERIDVLLRAGGVVLERIRSDGHVTPPGSWYDQERDEWVVLVSGSAAIRFEDGGLLEMGPGDWVMIPAHARHRVERTSSPAVWLALHLDPPPPVPSTPPRAER